MRVAIVGSRNYPNLWEVEEFVEKLSRKYPHAWVISGRGRGVDVEAEDAAFARMLHVRSYRPRKRDRHYEVVLHETGRFATTIRGEDNRALTFKSWGQAAFYRNRLIVEDSAVVVAFHYQASAGTQNTIDIARSLGKPVHIYHPED
jgi:predicted Rossmann fold nucleotide-binding protein DprA/Smf involved in DNA uptake